MKCIYCDMYGMKESSSDGMQTVIIPTIIQKYDEGIRGQLTSTKIAVRHTASEPLFHRLVHTDDNHTVNKDVI